MECLKAEELLMKYMDNALTENEATELSKHVEVCSNCKEEFLIYDNMLKEFMEIEFDSAPENFTECVMKKVNELEPVSKKIENVKDNLFWILCGGVSVFLGLGFLLVVYKDFIINSISKTSLYASFNSFLEPISKHISDFLSTGISDLSGLIITLIEYVDKFKFFIIIPVVALYVVNRFVRQRN